MKKNFFVHATLVILSLSLLACNKIMEESAEEESTEWLNAKTYEEKETIMQKALNAYVGTELTECYLKKHIEDNYLNDEIAIYFNSNCDLEHQRGLYINGEYFEYEPFLEDLNPQAFESSLFELISPRNQDYLLVFNGYNGTTYGILLQGSLKQGKSWRWWVEKFHAPQGGSFADIAGDYSNHWMDQGGEDSFWGRYSSDQYGFQNINSETVKRAQEAQREALNEGYPKEEVVWDGSLLNLKRYCEDYTACDYFYETESGEVLSFPENLGAYLGYRSLISGGRGVGTYSLSPDETDFFYLSSRFNIDRYNWQNEEEESLVSIYEDTDGISDFVWSPSGNKVAFVVTNMNRSEEYPLWNKVFVLEFDEQGSFLGKEKYDLEIFSSCHSGGCNANSDSFYFLSEDTLSYESYNREAYYQEAEELQSFWLELKLR